MCHPNGDEQLDDCPGNFDGCTQMLDRIVWSGFIDPVQSLSWVAV
jgi:hypothetical protein